MAQIVFVPYFEREIGTEILGVFENKLDAETVLLKYLCENRYIFTILLEDDEHRRITGYERYNAAHRADCSFKDIFVDNESKKQFKDIIDDPKQTFPYHFIKPEYRNFNFLSEYHPSICFGTEWDFAIKEIEFTRDLACNIKG